AWITSVDAQINNPPFDFTKPLAPGASLTIFVTRTVQAGDPDPTPSTVTFTATDDLAGTDAPIMASVTDSVNLFQPSAKMTPTANPTTAPFLGQVITYTAAVSNTSSTDSPNLVLDTSNPNNSFTDTLLTTAAKYNLEADALTKGLVFLDTNQNAVLDPGETILGTGFTSL